MFLAQARVPWKSAGARYAQMRHTASGPVCYLLQGGMIWHNRRIEMNEGRHFDQFKKENF